MNGDRIKRWHIAIIYRGEAGPVVVDYNIEELDELSDLVERGPDWNSILTISVELNSPDESVVLQSPLQKDTSND